MRDDNYDDEPELAGFEPHGDRPLRSPHLVTAMRVIVVIGVVGLILPGILIGAGTAQQTAQRTCEIYTAHYAPGAMDFSVRFELVSASGTGWNCYAVAFGGDETLLAALGLIPGGARIPAQQPQDS